MKKILFTLCIALLACVAMQARTYVLAVGVSNYQGTSNDLSNTTKDAKSFKKLMENKTKDITLVTSRYATKANIKEKLRAISNRAGAGDQVIFFYSGHGADGCLAVYDGMLTYSDIVNILDSSKADMKVCYIDACHAGTAVSAQPTSAQAASGKKNMVFFVSCRPDEYSFENSVVGAGFFTQALTKGLRGKSDSNGDKRVTVSELFKYMYNDVVKRSDSLQHPQLICPEAMKNAVLIDWN
ncbi:MAG: caspase family protein [Muribaculaceae bacterium]|nr:caspase family protein [Muribaculaceae bacterium]